METAKTTLTAMLLLALVAVPTRARASTATDLPPKYQSKDAIEEGPARLLGDGAGLEIKNGLLTGRLERGAYRVKIAADSARGTGPMGMVDLHIARVGQDFDVAGLWNGGHLHFVVGPDRIRGSALKQVSDEDRGYQSCRYEADKVGSGPVYTGLSECLGANPLRFEVTPGTSADLTDEENVILLVAYFAAPPAVWNP